MYIVTISPQHAVQGGQSAPTLTTRRTNLPAGVSNAGKSLGANDIIDSAGKSLGANDIIDSAGKSLGANDIIDKAGKSLGANDSIDSAGKSLGATDIIDNASRFKYSIFLFDIKINYD